MATEINEIIKLINKEADKRENVVKSKYIELDKKQKAEEIKKINAKLKSLKFKVSIKSTNGDRAIMDIYGPSGKLFYSTSVYISSLIEHGVDIVKVPIVKNKEETKEINEIRNKADVVVRNLLLNGVDDETKKLVKAFFG